MSGGGAALMAALKAGRMDDARRMLAEAGRGGAAIDANHRDAMGQTVLMYAASRDDPGVVRALLGAGGDPNLGARDSGNTALLACVLGGSDAVMEALLEGGADPNAHASGAFTALMSAARDGRVGMVRALLRAGADTESGSYDGLTALMIAVGRDGNEAVVRALLEAGADACATTTGAVRSCALLSCCSPAHTEMLLPHTDRDLVQHTYEQVTCGAYWSARVRERVGIDAAIVPWLNGTHRLQRARREAERVLLEASREMPPEIASLCGEYLHAGRLAAAAPCDRGE